MAKKSKPPMESAPLTTYSPDSLLSFLVAKVRERRVLMSAKNAVSNQLDAQERNLTGKGKGPKAKTKAFAVSEVARAAAYETKPRLASYLAPMQKDIKAMDKEIAASAAKLPVYGWVESVRGVGPLMLGLIVGECGDLGGYANPAKVWKRMGLAVMPDGTRQRRVKGEEAIFHGYDPRRRSVAYLIGDCLIKGNRGYYRKLYDDRKAMEFARLDGEKGAKGHAHMRASRYIQKRFLKHLWQAWRRTVTGLEPSIVVSVVTPETLEQESESVWRDQWATAIQTMHVSPPSS